MCLNEQQHVESLALLNTVQLNRVVIFVKETNEYIKIWEVEKLII